ncbi:MAG: hypothetical protein VSS75_028670 [Candidatus Parabeggiatoa sp.]|nr:hypothetical protein [Candidatus Parabeggiatoa sp.]
MSENWREAVNQSINTAKIDDINQYVIPSSSLIESPIDAFYATTQEILNVGQPDFLHQHPAMGTLLLVGLISSIENYFRDLFARIIRICPIAQAASSDQAIKLGSVIWHREGQVERSAFEHISFADADTIKNTCKKVLKYDLKKSDLTNELLQEFGKICELRHGIVHANSFLPGKNAIKLEMSNNAPNQALKITVGYEQLQECSLISTMLIASFNTELFEEMAKRWAVDWPKLPSWDPARANALFKKIWDAFYSKRDQQNCSISTSLTMQQCRNRIKKEFS